MALSARNIKDRLYNLLGSDSAVEFVLKNNFNLTDEIENTLILNELTYVIYQKSLYDYLKEEPKAVFIFEAHQSDVINYHGTSYEGFIAENSFSNTFPDDFDDMVKSVIDKGKIDLLTNAIENNMQYSL